MRAQSSEATTPLGASQNAVLSSASRTTDTRTVPSPPR
ncbi:hypothetical protein SAMN06295924_10930 [Rathayibacter rathayi NCPPB 2980 = VKM Ac-1601]|nr:hypothetical protein FB469_0777 [Rathayibacter rathayi]SOE05349.1 hypothetical protein SAMN06295924_10930 [Rathayibacter rathayi NCPPB 2980 = VKM Ac-1601]